MKARRAIALAVAALVGMLGVVAVATPAQANYENCASSAFCTYTNANGVVSPWPAQSVYYWTFASVGTGCVQMQGFTNNTMSSKWNRKTVTHMVYVYDSGNCTGWHFVVYAGEQGNMQPWQEDIASSFRFVELI